MWYNNAMSKQNPLPFSSHSVVLTVVGLSFLVGTFVLPMGGLRAISGSQGDGRPSSARAYHAVWREQRRHYSLAMEECRDRRQQGQAVDCAAIKINDPQTFQPFLQESVANTTSSSGGAGHAAAPELTVDVLSEKDRAQLRRYQRAGTCSRTLKDYLPGFYELCERVTTEMQLPPLGRGRSEPAAQQKIPNMSKINPRRHMTTANDIAEANKRPVPASRISTRLSRTYSTHSSVPSVQE